MPRAPDAFAVDLSAWAETQARALREGRLERLDRANLSAEIGRLGLRERHALRARLGILLTGLLRWSEQVDLRCHGWAATIDGQRHAVALILRDSPSLRREIPDLVARIYSVAKARAVLESGLFDDSFAGACPFSEEDILTSGSYPDPYGDDAIRGPGWWSRRGSP
jgi:hypothetical protein